MNKVTSYLKNIGKSVSYATVDVVTKNLIPDVSSFTETNKDIFKAVYSTATNSKKAISYGKRVARDNQLYKDVNVGINNVFDDIKSGNFYNKAREQAVTNAAGENMAGGFDDFDFDFDFDDGSLDQFQDNNSDDITDVITSGEATISNSVVKSSNLASQLISTTVAKTSKALVNTQINSTNMIMAQNVELMAGLRTSIAGVHQSVNALLKFTQENITAQINNESKYFETTTSIMQENNAILKEMLEMQRNMYKTQKVYRPEDDFENVFSGGILNVKEYFKVIGKNLKGMDKTGTVDMLSMSMGGQSMLSSMLANPLGFVMTGLVQSAMPKNVAKSIFNFNKTLGNLFPAMVVKLNKMKTKGGFSGFLGELLGLNMDTKSNIDTSKYKKDAVPFDGITRKAIVDVIPEHLSRIESLLSGRSQRIYDYESGKWLSAKDIKKKQQEDYDYYAKNGFSDLSELKDYVTELKREKALSDKQMKNLEKNILSMQRAVFKSGGDFNPEYIKKNMKLYGIENDPEIMENVLNYLSTLPTGKLLTVVGNTFDNRRRYANSQRDIESKGDSIIRKIFDNSDLDSHLKYDDKLTDQIIGLKNKHGIGANATDKFGYTSLDYLKDISLNLSYIRKYGIGGHGSVKGPNGNGPTPPSFSKYSKNFNKRMPKNIKEAQRKSDEEESLYNSTWYDKNVDFNAASIKAAEKVAKNDTEFDNYGKLADRFLKKDNKYKDAMDAIPGDSFVEKFRNAKSMKARHALIMGSLNDIAKKPSVILDGLITKADKSIYDFLFTVDTGTKDSNGKKIYGFFNSMMTKVGTGLESLAKKFDEKILEPLEAKYGLKTKFREITGKIFGEVQKDADGKIIKNDYGYAKREGGIKPINRTLLALQKNYSAIKKSTEKAVKSTFKDPTLSALHEILGGVGLKNIDNSKEEVQQLISKLTKEQLKELSDDEIIKLKKAGITGLAKGGKVTKSGLIAVSEGEEITVRNKAPRNIKNLQAKQETSRTLSALQDMANGGSFYNHQAQVDGGNLLDKLGIPGLAEGGKAFKESATNFVNDATDKAKKTKVGKVIIDIIKEMQGDNAADAAAKVILGGGAGLLFGAPLIGAAVGAGTSLIKNSNTVQKYLFGEKIVDAEGNETGERKDNGLISKDMQDTFKKYFPDMGTGSILGAASSLVLPFGPLGGAVLGAGIGLLKNSKTMNDMLFGSEDGLFNKNRKEKIKKYLPKAAVGALGGLLLGPFGFLGNAVLGSGVGLLTGTEEFKEMIFGEEDANGNRFGGLKGALEDNFVTPLKDFGTNFKNDFFGFIKESMVDPLNNAITPIASEIAFQTKRVVFGIPKMFAKLGKDYIAQPIVDKLSDYVVTPLGNLTKKLFGGVVNKVKGAISMPFRAVGALGNHFRRKQIREGRDVTGTAKDRIQFATDNKLGNYKYKKFDQTVADNSDNKEYLEELTARTAMLAHGSQYFEKQVASAGKELSAVLSEYYKLGWFSKDKKGYNRIRQHIKNNDVESAIIELNRIKESRTNGGRLDDAQASEAISRFAKANNTYQDAKKAREKFGTINKEQNEAWMREQFGDNWDKMDANRLFKYSTRELSHLTGNAELTKNEIFNPEVMITKGEKTINDTLVDIYKLLGGKVSTKEENKEYDRQVKSGINTAFAERSAKKDSIKNQLTKNGLNSSDDVVNNLYTADEGVYSLVLYAASQGVSYDDQTIIKLSNMDLDDEEISLLKSHLNIAAMPEEIIKQYLNKNRNNLGRFFGNRFFGSKKQQLRNLENLQNAAAAGVDINADIASTVTYGNGRTKYSHDKRLEYFKKLKELNLINKDVNIGGNKVKLTQDMILNINKGLSYDQMDSIIQENGGTADIDHSIKTNARSAFHNYLGPVGHGIGKGLVGVGKIAGAGILGLPLALLGLTGAGMVGAGKGVSSINRTITDISRFGLSGYLQDRKNKKEFEDDNELSLGQKVKYYFSEHGPIRYIIDEKGNVSEDHNDAGTKESLEKKAESDKQKSGIFNSLSSMKDGLLGFFGKKKDDEEDDDKNKEKKSWWRKLLDSPVGKAGKTMITVGGALWGIGKLSDMWTNEDETGPMHTMAQKISDAISPVITKTKDWLSGTGEYEGKGLPNWVEKDFLPNLWNGIDFVFEKVLPKLTESFILAAPAIFKAGIGAVKSLLGLGGNKHADDNKFTKNQIQISATDNSSTPVANINGVELYTKDKNGELIPITDEETLNSTDSFYTNSGAEYNYNESTGQIESSQGNTHKDKSLAGVIAKGAARSFATNTTPAGMKLLYKGANITSKIPGLKTFSNVVLKPTIKGADNIMSSGAKLNNYFKNATKKGTKNAVKNATGDIVEHSIKEGADAIANATSIIAKSENKRLTSKIIDFAKSLLDKLFGSSKVYDKVKESLAASGLANGPKAVKKHIDDIIKGLINTLDTKILKGAGSKALTKISVKIGKILSGPIGWILLIGPAVSDFITGFDQAQSILGLKDVSGSQRLLSALVNVVNNQLFFGFIETYKVVDWLAGTVLKIFGQDSEEFKRQQKETEEFVKQENLRTGRNDTVQDYFKNKTITGKIGNFFSDVGQKTKDFFSNLNPFKKKEKTSASESTGAASKLLEDYSKNNEQLVSPTQYSEAGTLAIGSQQEIMYQNLSQNIQSADQYMDQELGRIMGFQNMGLSQGLEKYNRNRSTKGTYTFADVLNNANNAMNTLATSMSPYTNNYTIGSNRYKTSTTTSNRTYGRPYSSSPLWSGVGTMNNGFVSQLDPKYKNKKFNTGRDSQYQTLGDSGCAPATAANVLNLYAGTGTAMDDASSAALRYKDKNSGVTPEYFQNYLGSKGIGTYPTMNKKEMLAGISSGRPTVLLGVDPTNKANTPYGAAGSHYVLATGMDNKGNVIVQDPESRKPNALYPAKELLGQSHLGMITGKGTRDVRNMKSILKSKLGNLGFGRGSDTVYQDLATWSSVTASELNAFISRYAGSGRGFSGKGEYFIKAAKASGLDPRYILAHAAWESGWGDSTYAKAGNFFGIGAFNSNPDNAYNYGHDSMESGLIEGAKWIRTNYYDAGQKTLYAMVHKPGHNYAVTDDGVGSESWMNGIAGLMDAMDLPNTNAVTHKPDDSVTVENSNSVGGLFDRLGEVAINSYFNKDLINLLFGNSSSSTSATNSEAGPGDITSAKEFYEKYKGQQVDFDGYYGTQCVDLFSQYLHDRLGVRMGGNDAKDFADDPRMDKYFNKVNLDGAQYGDWVVWGPNDGNPYGHIGMYTGMQDGKILTFGTNQGGDRSANVIPLSTNNVSAVFRLKSGQGSGKNKSFNNLPNIFNTKYSGKRVSLPKLNTSIYSGTGTKLPSLNYTSSTNNGISSSGLSTGYNVSGGTSKVESLITVVIDVLRIIADNSSKLSEVVALLSRALDVEMTNDDINNLKSNNAKIKNKIANALKGQGSPNGAGNSIMDASTEYLTNALYAIARA